MHPFGKKYAGLMRTFKAQEVATFFGSTRRCPIRHARKMMEAAIPAVKKRGRVPSLGIPVEDSASVETLARNRNIYNCTHADKSPYSLVMCILNKL